MAPDFSISATTSETPSKLIVFETTWIHRFSSSLPINFGIDFHAPSAVRASLARMGITLDDEAAGVEPALGTQVVSASDADDEIRTVVRGVVDAMASGVPLERMAVLYGTDEPYARLLHEHLEAAGIAHNGVSVRSLSEGVLGRAALVVGLEIDG